MFMFMFISISFQTSPGTKLQGWAAIQNHLLSYDTAVVKDYTDDIDTLLVFVRVSYLLGAPFSDRS